MVAIPDIAGFTASPHHPVLASIITGETGVSSAGYPTLAEASFQQWMREVPHLFQQGSALLDWLQQIETGIDGNPRLPAASVESWKRAIKVLETVIQTAGVTAPSDLWLLKHIL